MAAPAPAHIPPAREDDPLVDPPIIDLLYREGDDFVIGFIPDAVSSSNVTEGVAIPFNSIEGRQIMAWLEELGRLFELGAPAEKVFHVGGGDFGFVGPGGRRATLSGANRQGRESLRAYDALQYLGQTAQAAFLNARRAGRALAGAAEPVKDRRVG